MPWSAWQDGYTINDTVDRRNIKRTWNDAGTDPAYNKVDVLNTSTSGTVWMYATKSSTAPLPMTKSGWQYRTSSTWRQRRYASGSSPGVAWTNSVIQTLETGIDYAMIPGRDYRDPDAYIEFEAGDNILTWTPLALSLSTHTGAVEGNFRIRVLLSAPWEIKAAFGVRDISTWPVDDFSAPVIFEGTSATPDGFLLNYTPPPGTEAWFIFIETDSTATASLTIGYTPTTVVPILTTPRWRYWIPDVVPAIDTTMYNPGGYALRSMEVDCSGAAPTVLATHKNFGYADMSNSYATPYQLRVPDFNRTVMMDQYGRFFVWADDGSLIASLDLGAVINSVVGLFINPNDPTECAVVGEYPTAILVMGDLDTASPTVSKFVYTIPEFDDDEGMVSTDPYRVGPGIMEMAYTEDLTQTSIPLRWRNLHQFGPDQIHGAIKGIYNGPAGIAQYGAGRVAHLYVAEPLPNPTDYSLSLWVVDYKDPDNIKTKETFVPINDPTPFFIPNDYNFDWLFSGSNTLSADASRGVNLIGHTGLTRGTIDTTTTPGTTYQDFYLYYVSVATVNGPITAPDDPGPALTAIPTSSPVVTEVEFRVVNPTFYVGRWQGQPAWLDVTPQEVLDANHVIVGASPLDSEDNTSYMELTASVAQNSTFFSDAIGGTLELVNPIPAGHYLSGRFYLDIGFYHSPWRSTAPENGKFWVQMGRRLPDGSAEWTNSPREILIEMTPTETWRREIRQSAFGGSILTRDTAEALASGDAVFAISAYQVGGVDATLRVSYVRMYVESRGSTV